MSWSQAVFFSLQDVSKETEHSVGTLQRQNRQGRVQERMVAFRSSEVWWNSATSQLLRSLAGLINIYSDKTASSVKFSAIVAYPAHVLWSNVTERGRENKTDHWYTLMGLVLAGVAELGAVDGDLEVDDRLSFQGLPLLDVVSLEKLIP